MYFKSCNTCKSKINDNSTKSREAPNKIKLLGLLYGLWSGKILIQGRLLWFKDTYCNYFLKTHIMLQIQVKANKDNIIKNWFSKRINGTKKNIVIFK